MTPASANPTPGRTTATPGVGAKLPDAGDASDAGEASDADEAHDDAHDDARLEAQNEADHRRALERIVFSNGDPAQIERAARELRDLDRARSAVQDEHARASALPTVEATDEAPEPLPSDPPSLRRRPLLMAVLAVALLASGVLIGSVLSTARLADPVATPDGATLVAGDPLPSPSPGSGTAFIDVNTGQVVGYGGVEPAAALEVFDRDQTDADLPTFPLAADLQPSSTRLLEMAGSASIFAALDTLARPCLVVVGPNQYSATCQTDFEFPKAGIRLSWAPSVTASRTPSESGRTSPVVYTVVWSPNGMVDVQALVQGG